MQTPEEVKMQVIASAQSNAFRTMRLLGEDADQLHKMGYHAYSTVVSNMRLKVETALYELVEELEGNA